MKQPTRNLLPWSQHRPSWAAYTATLVLALALAPAVGRGQIEFEQEPINYDSASTEDAVSLLQQKLESGEAELTYDETRGYLPSVLALLDVPVSSQVLVFSKTSVQGRRISPRSPRAVYFNDHTYVGWVPGGMIEVVSTDPDLGAVFYTLAPERREQPAFVRDQGNCLVCHASSRTQDVPGVLVRSVFPDRSGQPRFGAGTFDTNHASPFKERWGGWYVTGTHGSMRHMGNVFVDRDSPDAIDRDAGANVTDLSDRLDLSKYLTPHSDLVALMVLEHQSQMQNLLTRANYQTRSAMHRDAQMNRVLDRPDDYTSDTTRRGIVADAERVLRYMLFCDEFRLTDPVQGTSPFAEEFAAAGPRDSRGRSLRDLDLQTRLLKYPCSPLIASPSFDRLPEPVRAHIAQRLREVLTGADQSEEFSHLSADDRQAVLEILEDTKPELWSD